MGSFCILSNSFQHGQGLSVSSHYSPLYGYIIMYLTCSSVHIDCFSLCSYRQCCLNVITSHTFLYVHWLSSPKNVCSKFWQLWPADVLNVISNKCTKVLVFSASMPELKLIIRFSFYDFFVAKISYFDYYLNLYFSWLVESFFVVHLTICKSFPTLSFALNLIMLSFSLQTVLNFGIIRYIFFCSCF